MTPGVIIIPELSKGAAVAVGDGRRMVQTAERAWSGTWQVASLITLGVDCLMQDLEGIPGQDSTSETKGGTGDDSATEAAALRRENQAMTDLRALRKAVNQMDTAAAQAHAILLRAVTVTDVPGADHPEWWCMSCAGHGHRTVPTHPGLRVCQWCQRWREAHAMQLPPPEVVNAHHEGKPITVALLKRLEAEQAKSKRRGRKHGKWTDPHKPQKQTGLKP